MIDASTLGFDRRDRKIGGPVQVGRAIPGPLHAAKRLRLRKGNVHVFVRSVAQATDGSLSGEISSFDPGTPALSHVTVGDQIRFEETHVFGAEF
jgi:hypothetical protein